jgi:hypothetical protein
MASDEREQALQYAAKLRGLSLVRVGEKFALAHYVLSDASLDQVAAYLAADEGAASGEPQGDRRTNLRAMLKAERALLAEIERLKQRAAAAAASPDSGSTESEAALSEIRRRIAELQSEMGHKG